MKAKDKPAEAVISLFGNTTTHTLNEKNSYKKEIQIPLSIKESMAVFFGVEDLEIVIFSRINKGVQPFAIGSKNIHGLRWDEKSPYYDGFSNVAKSIGIYMVYPKDSVDHFLFNINRCTMGSFKYDSLEKFMSQNKYTDMESNLLLKLEILRESVSSNNLNPRNIEWAFDNIRKEIWSNLTKPELELSVHKLLRKLNSESST